MYAVRVRLDLEAEGFGRKQRDKMANNNFGEIAFEQLDKMVGGAVRYFVSEQTTAMAWAECQRNARLHKLVGLWLAGSSERAEQNLANLRAELTRVFGLVSVSA
jgi:hypothetical protein